MGEDVWAMIPLVSVGTGQAVPQRLSAPEWTDQFEEWADSFPDTAPIPDEALSRENLYPDRL